MKTEVDEKTNTIKKLNANLGALESERARLQDESEMLEKSLSNAKQSILELQRVSPINYTDNTNKKSDEVGADIEHGSSGSMDHSASDEGVRAEKQKKRSDPHPLLWSFWSLVSSKCPALLDIIGKQPPSICSKFLVNVLFVLYLVIVHWALFHGAECGDATVIAQNSSRGVRGAIGS